MNPKDFVGAQCWNSLNQGGVITDVENKEFVVRQKTGMFSNMVTRVADSVSRMLPLVKKERIVTEIGKRVAKQYPVRERLYLRMAAAGIIQYKTDREGQLFRDVIIPITRQNIIDFCGGSDSISVRKDIGKIETDLNRPGFRKLFCDLIIQEDIERCRSESLSPDETLNKKVEEYLGENITTTLVNHSRSVDSEQMLQSLRKNKDYPSVTERGIRNLDLLMLRLFMVRAGLIPAVEMEYAWQHFINEINTIKMWDFRESLWGGGYGMGNKSSDKLQKVINKSISHRAEIPTSMPGGIVRAKLINDLIYCQIPDKQSHVFFAAKAPENINLYRPEMEQADKAPGLVNRGNLCYYNSVIKMLANQVSIEALNRSLEGVSANSDMGTTGAVENQMLREKLINLLAAIKYFRAGYFCSEWVDEKSAEFFQQLQLRCQQDDVNKQFSDNRQNDVHELIQLLDKILGYSEKPEYSFRVTSQFKVTIGERFHGFKYKEDSSRETIITPNLKRGEAAGYMECLNDFFQEEVIDDFLWGSEHAEEFKLDRSALRQDNMNHRDDYQRELERYKEHFANSCECDSDRARLMSVKSIKLNEDGYFERATATGATVRSEIPPWIKPTKKMVLVVDPEKLQSLMLLPRIFSYTNQTGEKLHNEGIMFFESCLEGVDIPVIDMKGNSLNINTSVTGFCSHKGDINSGHYVYIEKSERGMWVLNNDQTVKELGNDSNLQKYLFDEKMTPYLYHLKLLKDHK